MSTGQQATLSDYTAPSPDAEAEPSGDDNRAQRASGAPDGSVDGLAAIFHDIVGEYETVEAQHETPSHEPVDPDYEVPDLSVDGLDDAADSDLQIGGWK